MGEKLSVQKKSQMGRCAKRLSREEAERLLSCMWLWMDVQKGGG